jgi:hypothetical protein
MIADVWIAPRLFNGANVTFEWYFMSDGFVVQENLAVEQNEPIKLIIESYGDKVNLIFIKFLLFLNLLIKIKIKRKIQHKF